MDEPGDAGAITLHVNGEIARVAADPRTPLLYVLRNDLGLTGARFGCGAGQCGACTVLVEGRPVTSCNTPAGSLEGARIETVESLSRDGRLHEVAAAFLEEQAGQCGYCIPGIMLRAKALLAQNPAPTRAEIAAALDGSLCRCGTHVRILRAVSRAAGARP